MQIRELVAKLAPTVGRIDLDSAASFIESHDLVTQLTNTPLIECLVERCVVCEVLDYSGRHADCKVLLERLLQAQIDGRPLMSLLQEFVTADGSAAAYSLNDLHIYRLYGTAWLQLGMLSYRENKYDDAKRHFSLSHNVLRRIHRHLPSHGEIARAEYCLGLVARQEHEYDTARQRFSDSVQYAWLGLDQVSQSGSEEMKESAYPELKSAAKGNLVNQIYSNGPALRYHIGRCLALGLGWIAYTRAALAEAEGYFVAARLLLKDSEVSYIHAYVNLLHACTLLSARGDNIGSMDEAIKIMLSAYQTLGGKQVLTKISHGLPAGGNGTYALRCANELGRGYLRAARFYDEQREVLEQQQQEIDNELREDSSEGMDKQKREQQREQLRRERAAISAKIDEMSKWKTEKIKMALEYVEAVKMSTNTQHGNLYGHETRTYCNALITETRLLRLQGRHVDALKVARNATTTGAKLGFTRIDCLLNLGEACYYAGRYAEALQSFETVRDDSRAQTNPKLLALCDLNLTRCYVSLGQLDDAHHRFQRWVAAGRPGRQNTFIRGLARRVEEMINSPITPFRINVDANLRYEAWHNELRHWLAANAMRRARNDKKEAGRLLGNKDRHTIENWIHRRFKEPDKGEK